VHFSLKFSDFLFLFSFFLILHPRRLGHRIGKGFVRVDLFDITDCVH
jgi:hypothetical protein